MGPESGDEGGKFTTLCTFLLPLPIAPFPFPLVLLPWLPDAVLLWRCFSGSSLDDVVVVLLFLLHIGRHLERSKQEHKFRKPPGPVPVAPMIDFWYAYNLKYVGMKRKVVINKGTNVIIMTKIGETISCTLHVIGLPA